MNDVTTYDCIIPLLFTMTTDPEQQYSRLTSDHTQENSYIYIAQRHGWAKPVITHSCVHVCALHKTRIQLTQEALYLYMCPLAPSQSGVSPSLPEKEHLL